VKRMSFLKEKQGFTLIELLCVVAVMGVIMLPLAGTFSSGYKVFHKEDENIKAMRLARGAMEKIVDMTRKAEPSEISVSDDGNIYSVKIGGAQISVESNDIFDSELKKSFESVKFDVKPDYREIYDSGDSEKKEKELIGLEYTIRIDGKRIKDYEISTRVSLRKD